MGQASASEGSRQEKREEKHDELSELDGRSGWQLERKSPSHMEKIHKQLHWVRRIYACYLLIVWVFGQPITALQY